MTSIPVVVNEISEFTVALGRLSTYMNQPEIEPPTWDTSCQTISFQKAMIGWPKAENAGMAERALSFSLTDVNFDIPTGRFTLVCGPLGSGKTLLVSRRVCYMAHPPSFALFSAKPKWSRVPSSRRDPSLPQLHSTETAYIESGQSSLGWMIRLPMRLSRATFNMGPFETTFYLGSRCGSRGTRRLYDKLP